MMQLVEATEGQRHCGASCTQWHLHLHLLEQCLHQVACLCLPGAWLCRQLLRYMPERASLWSLGVLLATEDGQGGCTDLTQHTRWILAR